MSTHKTLGLGSLSLWAVLLGSLLLASPADAQRRKKKAQAEESAQGSSVDDLMSGAARPSKSSKAQPAEEQAQPEEEEIPEPDAWERPPVEEERAPAVARTAPPEAPVGDGRQVEAGLLLGYGFSSDKVIPVDPYGLGFGVRAGYEFDFKLFLGAGFQYFLGSSEQRALSAGGIGAPAVESSANYMFAHLEAGYDIWVDAIILRPSLWIGMAIATQDPHPLTNSSKTISDAFFGPGGSVLYVTDGLFIGGDLRFFMVTGDGSGGVALFANGGLRL